MIRENPPPSAMTERTRTITAHRRSEGLHEPDHGPHLRGDRVKAQGVECMESG